jgi:hypothetical protein
MENYVSLDPAVHWGEVELRVDAIENVTNYPYLDDDGVPAKAYRSMIDMWRASKVQAGRYASEPDLKGLTRVLPKRRGSERQFPPGYSGTGTVVVELYPGFRYWRPGNAEPLTGRVACNPDEAVQLVATTSAVYV